MTKRHTRLFFIGGTLLFALIFLGLTIDSHRQFGALTNAENITEEVVEGKHVWHRNNCISCHTTFCGAASYPPDLAKINKQHGKSSTASLPPDPSQSYSNETRRRRIPAPALTGAEISQVIAFLDWVYEVDNPGGP